MAVEDPQRKDESGRGDDAATEVVIGPPTRTVGTHEALAGTVILPEAGAQEAAGTRIAAYALVRPIGRGGMGEVWLADQLEPIRRQVALKLIKTGMDTREVIARFESERQMLALMDHPAIAKVFDAGSTPQGRPYFVMEYVTGIPITEYCDQHKLTVRQRLELFVRVCEGVQHAHQKAILHRDLKPSNILVSEVDGKPAPRIIDFGLAKATSPHVAVDAMATRVGAIVGTPAYMSPEQANPSVLDVDTRTDVYSLGVILYELLAGTLPLEYHKIPLHEMLRKLREEDSPRPSSKLRGAGKDSSIAGQNRSVDVAALARQLRGDLDAIALKALEKDRSRRYDSASELAADIARYLNNQPVMARPATVTYRARKYARRHRIAVSVAAFVAIVLVLFAVAQTFELRRTRLERDRADRITQFMISMFKVSDPSEARGNEIRVREILDKASQNIATGLTKDPELEAQMMQVMGTVYDSLGLYSRSESLLKQAVAVRRRVLGDRNPATLASMHDLAGVVNDESRYAEAEKLARETLDARRSKLGPDNRATLESMNQLALILNNEGHFGEAEKLHRQVAETARRVLGPQDPVGRKARHDLAIDLAYEGKFAESEQVFREDLDEMRRALGPDHPDVLGTMNNLAATLQHEEKWAEAEKLYQEALPLRRRVNGPDHPYTLMTMGNLALCFFNQKRYAEAEKLFRETLEIKRKTLGPEHRSTLVTMGNLADTLHSEGQYPESEKLFRETLDTMRRILGESHSDYLDTLYAFGGLLQSEKRYGEAERVLRKALETQRRVLGDAHPDTASSAFALAEVLAEENKRDEAFENLEFAVDHQLPADARAGLEKDEAFKGLRGSARFEALVAASVKPGAVARR